MPTKPNRKRATKRKLHVETGWAIRVTPKDRRTRCFFWWNEEDGHMDTSYHIAYERVSFVRFCYPDDTVEVVPVELRELPRKRKAKR